MQPAKLVILSGPSGVGKDTVIEAWSRRNPRIARVVAYTTRAPRPKEIAGTDYHFIPVEEFLDRAANGDFLEFKEVHGNYYATPLADMDRMLENGKIAILKIDVQGARVALEARPEALTVFLMPPSTAELERRMMGRGTEDDETARRRLRNALDEIVASEWYQHRVVNNKLEETVDQLEEIVNG